ncbi:MULTISPECIES: aminotransferase class V-fold PLP-dependent enzyme [unclassified Pseudomonas]|uniref:aminotransferase class V-fold PLP-dependent enzyme n=1 Tax=unclassified Pseudomonas TaxID=196821 RepID=UPI000D6FEC86|nr:MULTISPECIES: aminotransferase class V-fold PLP-dependent enzyme [unclassified Pseudomonas]MED5607158.1 aminotransferase class V-fold PLP-dependent enzyme [Pseudomonas sp. JH-2]PWU28551.1 aminotransferase [Pseudomonas sp. RW407]
MIHFNTAGAGLLSAQALQAMQTFLQAESEQGAYETELASAEVLDHAVYQNIARLLGAQPADIALFDSATKAWVTALDALDWHCGDRILITPYEYAGNLIALDNLRQRHGLMIETIPLLDNGDLDLAWLARYMRDNVKLVSVVHVPSCCGIVNNVAAIGRLLRGYPCTYFVDACQSVGMLPINVQEIGCDVLTAAGRKFLCGPRGTGFACLSAAFRARARPRFTDLHRATFSLDSGVTLDVQDARYFEYAERNGATLMGLNVAVLERLQGGYVDDCEAYRFLVESLKGYENLQLIIPGAYQRGIISFFHESISAPETVGFFRSRGINCWPGYASHTPGYMTGRVPARFVRVSLGCTNTIAQAEQFLRLLQSMSR